MEEVIGSIPIGSTNKPARQQIFNGLQKTASLFPFSTAACRTGFLVLKLRTLALFTDGLEGPGPPSPVPPLFCVSSW
jgi:hypothetical protein